ncbi:MULTISPECIES: ABC transporter ATP-binding protein [unclassified Raoultella]|uniref:ABC transporter ATP-binding protein n=1 Tax=unclassified Raoultella TaxID=2627600 RepID=UPI00190FA3B1|nr:MULTISPECIES: ABC transporter ATP-binding protein [unclassified Raoultella]
MMCALTGIKLDSVSFAFGANTVLNNIDLHIEAGSIVALLGPSGCGKSTLLRLLAGLTVPASGEIRFGDRLVAKAGWGMAPEQRDIGMVFQDYALWPHMTVAQNIAFPLRMRGVPRGERQTRVNAALARVGLTGFAERKPSGLSGGQQQRVALARAIVAEPRVLLFDEPLSNLDSELRESLCIEMSRLLRQLGITAVYVTHDRREAELLADRIVHLSAGSVAAVRIVTSSSGEPA